MYQQDTLYHLPDYLSLDKADWYWPPVAKPETLVIVQDAQWQLEEQQTVEKLIQAIQQNKDNTAIVVLAPQKVLPLGQWRHTLGFHKVIALGPDAAGLALQLTLPDYTPLEMAGFTMVRSDAVSLLNQQPKRKAALWAALQQIFKV